MSAATILVIKLGALGDFVQALGPMAAIRSHHRDARIVLLTTAPFVAFAKQSTYVDEVWVDDRPKVHQVGRWLALRRRLRGAALQRVYDLQTSSRSSRYFQLFWPGPYPEWVGIARECSHPHANPRRDSMHTIERQAEQLGIADIAPVPPPDLSWARADFGRFGLADRFVLLIPGGAPHRPGKRWPAERYASLAQILAQRGLQPVLLGTDNEAASLDEIAAACPTAVSLAGQTSLLDIAALARSATAAVGNDTGPMHLAAAAGCPSVVMFSHESDPALCGQRGPMVRILRRSALADLGVAEVVDALNAVSPRPRVVSGDGPPFVTGGA
ncbi:MAG: glycosyltransferase family 9 protein [Rhodospirillales bacterium]|nr:glycosyltransferase family 9 protein [Rhodospirillales bacterium]